MEGSTGQEKINLNYCSKLFDNVDDESVISTVSRAILSAYSICNPNRDWHCTLGFTSRQNHHRLRSTESLMIQT